jgi:hypothetical protein
MNLDQQYERVDLPLREIAIRRAGCKLYGRSKLVHVSCYRHSPVRMRGIRDGQH